MDGKREREGFKLVSQTTLNRDRPGLAVPHPHCRNTRWNPIAIVIHQSKPSCDILSPVAATRQSTTPGREKGDKSNSRGPVRKGWCLSRFEIGRLTRRLTTAALDTHHGRLQAQSPALVGASDGERYAT